tara:strand:+ start:1104 stop:1208 length:105 start_codon:yes stop_codon:yes gene_type:complete
MIALMLLARVENISIISEAARHLSKLNTHQQNNS